MLFDKDEVIKQEKYGVDCWVHTRYDEERKVQCLCFNCAWVENCKVAAKGLKLCKEYNIAFMVTRCPDWEFCHDG